MFCFVLAAGLLLPQVELAQLFGGSAFRECSYVLAESHLIRYTEQLRLQDGSLGGTDITAVFAEQPLIAQFNHFEAGSYVLRNQPSVRHYGQIKLRNGRKLVV